MNPIVSPKARGAARRFRCLAQLALSVILGCEAEPGNAAQPMPTRPPEVSAEAAAVLYRPLAKSTGDLTPETRTIRVLTAYGRITFFVANGRPTGIEAEAFSAYADYLNKQRRAKHAPKVSVVFIPVRFENLIPFLLEGKGDIAAGLITVTDDRRKEAAFTNPTVDNVSEVVVVHAGGPPISSADDLSGRTAYVQRATSYVDHLNHLNQRLAAAGRKPVAIVEVEGHLNGGNILEMVNAGIFPLTVVDNYQADLWAKVLPDINVLSDVVLSKDKALGWAVRPNNPELLASLNGFLEYVHRYEQARVADAMRRYFTDTQWIKNPIGSDAFQRAKALIPAFRAAGAKYDFDWLMLMAQGFQESGLMQNRHGRGGATGVMQIKPSAARTVGYRNISTAAENIAAGAAYLNFTRKRFFDDPAISPAARVDFALASYNTGPNRIDRMRRLAASRGLDPNVWFDNVELVALDRLGPIPVRYVSNIYMYYVAYRMTYELDQIPAAAADARP